jgi:hypothetical protein
MAYDSVSVTSPVNADKPAEHPARAIMAKRWEARRAEARARRITALKLGDSGLIALASLSGAPAADSCAPVPDAVETSSAPPASDDATAHGFRKTRSAPPPPAADGGGVVTPAPASVLAVQPQAITRAPSWLRDSRKAMLVVAVVSNGVLLALLYFGGFLG